MPRDIEEFEDLSPDARRLYDWMVAAFTGDVNEARALAQKHGTRLSKWPLARLRKAHVELKDRGVLAAAAPDLKEGPSQHHATKKTPAQLDREIEKVLTSRTGVSSRRHSTRARPDRSIIVRLTPTRWPGGVKVRVVKLGADVRQGVRAVLPVGALAVMHPEAGEKLPDGTVRVHEDELRDTADC